MVVLSKISRFLHCFSPGKEFCSKGLDWRYCQCVVDYFGKDGKQWSSARLSLN